MACSLCDVGGLGIPCSAHTETGSQSNENERSKHRDREGKSSYNGEEGSEVRGGGGLEVTNDPRISVSELDRSETCQQKQSGAIRSQPFFRRFIDCPTFGLFL